jgi:hypothetical protein
MLPWTYDLALAFLSLCLPPGLNTWTIGTFRRELRRLPAEWSSQGRRNTPWLPADYPGTDLLTKTLSGAWKVRPQI